MLPLFRNQHIPRQSRRCGRSSTPRISTRVRSRSRPSRSTLAPSSSKAVAEIVDDADVLLEFYRYPAERWIHLRTTNPALHDRGCSRGLRRKVTKGPGHARPELPWPTSSSTPHKPAGARSQMHPTKARVIQREQSADTGTGHGVPDCGQRQGNQEKPARTLRGTEPCSAAPKAPTYMRTSVNV